MKTNDTKYTEEFVLSELELLLKSLIKDKDIVYIWQLFETKTYSRQRYSEWIKKYSDNEKIREMSDTIKNILETRVNVWGLVNKLNPSIVKFNLINNFDWKEKTEVDQNTNMNLNVNIENASDDELNSLINK